jgi:hypothetical protein
MASCETSAGAGGGCERSRNEQPANKHIRPGSQDEAENVEAQMKDNLERIGLFRYRSGRPRIQQSPRSLPHLPSRQDDFARNIDKVNLVQFTGTPNRVEQS